MIGQTISHYKIAEKLGEGGMGVAVYKAEDTKLDRSVALKFLAAHLLGNEDVRRRFEREAKAAAVLHHPNICPVFEIDEANGKVFIAMAFIEGESLDGKIAQGPLKLEEALDIAQQVALGLEAAHKKGIFHRDIKPENLIVNDTRHVTIMDFGLAQLTEASRLTQADETMGTVAYMSPEQTEGSGTDHRTDVWSLGVVLYEMIAGQQPFKGDYDKAIMYSILNEEPEPLTALRTGVPVRLEDHLNKALAKRRDSRYQSATELMIDLKSVSETMKSGGSRVLNATQALPAGVQSWPARLAVWLPWALFAVTALAFTIYAYRDFTGPLPQRRVQRFSLFPRNPTDTAISPDGRYVAYVTGEDAEATVWILPLAGESANELEGTEGARDIFWSPDSQSIGFATLGELKRVSLAGGDVLTLCELPGRNNLVFRGGSWSPDGNQIVITAGGQLYGVPARGGQARLVFERDESERGHYFGYPNFLPLDGNPPKLIYTFGPTPLDLELGLLDLKTGERRRLESGARATYSASGHLVYQTGLLEHSAVQALPFSLKTLAATGESFPVEEDGYWVSIAVDGTLVFLPGRNRESRQLVLRDLSGVVRQTIGDPQPGLRTPVLSPDGRQVAVVTAQANNDDIWVYDIEGNRHWRVTFDSAPERYPVWSPSGDQIVFSSTRGGSTDIYIKPADGTGKTENVVGGRGPEHAYEWSFQGNLIFNGYHRGSWALYYKKMVGQDAEPVVFLSTRFEELSPDLSPDERFIAYTSNESGRGEVYVLPFPEAGRKTQVSNNGGQQPRWSQDGSRIFYVQGDSMMAVSVTTTPVFDVGPAERLFELPGAFDAEPRRSFDVSAGGRFVISEAVGERQPTIRLVQNWYEEFRDREQD